MLRPNQCSSVAPSRSPAARPSRAPRRSLRPRRSRPCPHRATAALGAQLAGPLTVHRLLDASLLLALEQGWLSSRSPSRYRSIGISASSSAFRLFSSRCSLMARAKPDSVSTGRSSFVIHAWYPCGGRVYLQAPARRQGGEPTGLCEDAAMPLAASHVPRSISCSRIRPTTVALDGVRDVAPASATAASAAPACRATERPARRVLARAVADARGSSFRQAAATPSASRTIRSCS